ncbi:MAG TPA: hypothetical protein VMM77_06125, partial [Gemmatimonadaceae bacterium]|nr:hypothetical protein [Gemmatimonadaceae bacterium]
RHRAVQANRPAIEEVREVWRRLGGGIPRLGEAELARLYEDRLADVDSMDEFRSANLALDLGDFVSDEARARAAALPDAVTVRGAEVPIQYDVESEIGGVARLRLPEKMARTLVEAEVPVLDRPVRFMVMRGKRGTVRAANIDELQEALDRPWFTADEYADDGVPVESRAGGEKRGRGGERARGGGRRSSARGSGPRGSERGGNRSGQNEGSAVGEAPRGPGPGSRARGTKPRGERGGPPGGKRGKGGRRGP